jgi:hypothetical protein
LDELKDYESKNWMKCDKDCSHWISSGKDCSQGPAIVSLKNGSLRPSDKMPVNLFADAFASKDQFKVLIADLPAGSSSFDVWSINEKKQIVHEVKSNTDTSKKASNSEMGLWINLGYVLAGLVFVSGLMSGLWVLFTSRPRNPEPN